MWCEKSVLSCKQRVRCSGQSESEEHLQKSDHVVRTSDLTPVCNEWIYWDSSSKQSRHRADQRSFSVSERQSIGPGGWTSCLLLAEHHEDSALWDLLTVFWIWAGLCERLWFKGKNKLQTRLLELWEKSAEHQMTCNTVCSHCPKSTSQVELLGFWAVLSADLRPLQAGSQHSEEMLVSLRSHHLHLACLFWSTVTEVRQCGFMWVSRGTNTTFHRENVPMWMFRRRIRTLTWRPTCSSLQHDVMWWRFQVCSIPQTSWSMTRRGTGRGHDVTLITTFMRTSLHAIRISDTRCPTEFWGQWRSRGHDITPWAPLLQEVLRDYGYMTSNQQGYKDTMSWRRVCEEIRSCWHDYITLTWDSSRTLLELDMMLPGKKEHDVLQDYGYMTSRCERCEETRPCGYHRAATS